MRTEQLEIGAEEVAAVSRESADTRLKRMEQRLAFMSIFLMTNRPPMSVKMFTLIGERLINMVTEYAQIVSRSSTCLH